MTKANNGTSIGLKHNYGDALKKSILFFEDKYRGSYSDSLGSTVCPFYCDFGGYQDELVWAAAWLLKATKLHYYQDNVNNNIVNVKNIGEFGWDTKDAGINVLLTKARG
ncbi:unnamed protein product [Lupinus luteus]|uniref:cellulase n=1 Tax=Lupinus luteus TaxID=3873 RepID=A0AAV1W0U9_LUPLU